MKKYIYSNNGLTFLEVVEATPQCGDICESCGDCLHCYGEDACSGSRDGEHFWIEYRDASSINIILKE